MSSSKSVAIIGGGMAGLMCATKLRQLGMHNVVVFDTGKNAVGGRMSSRDIVVKPDKAQGAPGISSLPPAVLRVDHSAQMLSATTPRFQRMLDHWQGLGLIRSYVEGAVGTVDAETGAFAPRGAHLPPVYHPLRGMRSLAEHLAQDLTVQRPVWVGRVQRRDPAPGAPVRWDVYGERSKHLGAFDFLVVAHNGKCADRLMSTAEAPSIHALLKTKFTPAATTQQVMQMCSLWVAVLVFPKTLGLPYQAAFVDGHPTLSFLSNNSARLSSSSSGAANGAAGQQQQAMEAWTLISTRQFGSNNKVPQEAIPPAKEREVTAAMLDALSEVTRLPRASLDACCHARLQLWGAAVPLNLTDAPCAFDADLQAGIAGDWLVAPSLEGAALSGVALAERIAAHAAASTTNTQSPPSSLSVGLNCRFRPTQGPPLGAVPTDPPKHGESGRAGPGPAQPTPRSQQQQRQREGGEAGRRNGSGVVQQQPRPQRPASASSGSGSGSGQQRRQGAQQQQLPPRPPPQRLTVGATTAAAPRVQ